MTITASSAVDAHRPIAVLTAIGLLIFLAVSALAGGFALTFGQSDGVLPPSGWLEAIPLIDSWRIPGLVLGVGFGLGSLLSAYGLLRRPRWLWVKFLERLTGNHWSWGATILIGLGHVIWIGLELVLLPELSLLQAVYGPLGLALLLLPFSRSVSGYLQTR